MTSANATARTANEAPGESSDELKAETLTKLLGAPVVFHKGQFYKSCRTFTVAPCTGCMWYLDPVERLAGDMTFCQEHCHGEYERGNWEPL